MRSRTTLLAWAAALALPAGAEAAEIAVDRACYADPSQRSDTVQLTGTGFTPGAAYQVTLDGEPLPGGTGVADASGAIRGSFSAPQLVAGRRRASFTLGVQEGTNAPTTTFTVTRLVADFAPSSGDPRSLRVRFLVFGFELGGVTRPPMYVHYVTPGGRLHRTVALGRATGLCGSLRTSRRRLFPFRARPGLWRLQFDSNRRYRAGTAASPFAFSRVGVRVRRSG